MRGQMALAVFLLAHAAPAAAQSPEAPPTAEQMIETAREVYTVSDDEPELEPCPEATTDEIVVCRQYRDLDEGLRVASPTERAYAAGEMPADPVPHAPNVFGIPPCKAYLFCAGIGRDPPPILIIDLEAIPEALTPEEAALVFRAEDLPNREEASPAAVP
jgi:hypothetical protein